MSELSAIAIVLLALSSLYLNYRNKKLQGALKKSEVENVAQKIANDITNTDIDKLIDSSNKERLKKFLSRGEDQ